jgi:hypothetical protein
MDIVVVHLWLYLIKKRLVGPPLIIIQLKDNTETTIVSNWPKLEVKPDILTSSHSSVSYNT